MKNNPMCLGLLFLSLITAIAAMAAEQRTPASRASTAAEEAKIRKILENHISWSNARDWESIRTEFADDVVVMSDFVPSVTGKEEVTELFRDNFAQQVAAGLTVSMTASLDEVQVFGDWAFDRGTFLITYTAKDGEQKQYHLRFLEIFRKQPDGSWKIVRGMNNNLPPATQGSRKAAAASPNLSRADSMPAVDQILDKYVQAIGGRDALRRATSRFSRGAIEFPFQGLTGTVEIQAKAPNKSVTTITATGFGVIRQGFDGTAAWAQDPQTGLRELSGGELAARRRDSDFYREIKLKEIYPQMAVRGREKVGDREAYLVEATPSDGAPEKLYFDTQTGLLVRRDVGRDSPQGRIPVETRYEDYREIDGIKIPFVIRSSNPVSSFTIKLHEVRHNVAVDDAKFSQPASP